MYCLLYKYNCCIYVTAPCWTMIGLNRKSSPVNITHAREFQTLYFLVGAASEARIDKIAKNIEFLILKEI